MALAYEQNLTDFIGAVRTQFGVPNLPFVIGQIHSKNTGPYKLLIQEAQLNVSLAVPNTALVYTDDLSLWGDLLHYDSAGQLDLGSRFASAMIPFGPVAVSVDSITYTTEGGKGGNKDLRVTVALFDDEVNPVAGASVSVTLDHESGTFW
ncbi:MAG: hypothetical protein IH786_02685 [Proteobacteria bacterium]|nr:hypothetical protein [Pseudomonadota bacterium]